MTAEREGLAKEIAGVLGEHRMSHRSIEGPNTSCSGCNWSEYVPFGSSAVLAHQAHLADALADLLAARDRRVRAEALRDLAYNWPDMDVFPSEEADAIRDRADRIEAEG